MIELNLKAMEILVLGYLLAIGGGYVLVRITLKKFPLNKIENKGFPTAGAVIGAFERALIITFVLANEYMAIGFVLMAKSIIRFEGSKNQKYSEYFLIGTLSSMFFAILCGALTLWLLNAL